MSDGFQPLFTFGFERSGTTLLSMVLGSHPGLAVPFSPTGLWYRYEGRLADYDGLATPAGLARLVDDVLGEERIRLWDVELDAAAIVDGLPLADYAAVVRRVHEQYAAKTGKPHWAMHDIATLYHLDRAAAWFDSARFVHIVRDVRDVVLSFRGYEYGSANLCETACRWSYDLHASLSAGRVLGPQRYKVLRYEDLIAEPAQTLADLCRFCGLAFADDMLSYGQAVSEKVPSDKRHLWPALSGPLDTKKIGRWREGLRRHEVRAVEEIAGPVMEQLGYTPQQRDGFSPRAELFLLTGLATRGGRGERLRRRLRGGR